MRSPGLQTRSAELLMALRWLLLPFLLGLGACAGGPATDRPAPAPASSTLQVAVQAFNQRDYPAALALFQSITMQPSHPDMVAACKALGVMYSRGLGIERDLGVGTRYIRRAAEGGDAESQAEMARRYDFAIGVQRDTGQIVHWAQQASLQGNPQGHQYMGWAHHFGIGVEQSLQAAVAYYELAVAGGDPIAQNNLAVLLQKGEGVPQDMDRALQLFEASAVQGFAAAQIQLGVLHFRGEQVPQSMETAEYWLTQAADRGHALGAFLLAEVLESRGQLDAARARYQQAVSGGVEQAHGALKRLETSSP